MQTPVDVALEDLVAKRQLRELKRHKPRLIEARALALDKSWREALEMLAPLADLDVDFDPAVRAARRLRRMIEAEGTELPVRAQEALEEGRPLLAHVLLTQALEDFPETDVALLAAPRLRRLERDTLYKNAKRAWRELQRAADAADRGKLTADIQLLLDRAAGLSDCTEVNEAIAALQAALDGPGGVGAVPAAWRELQP